MLDINENIGTKVKRISRVDYFKRYIALVMIT